MTKVFGYKELDANQLVVDYRATGSVTIQLKLRPALIVLKLAKIYRSLSPRSSEPLTTFSSIGNIFSILWLSLKIRIFYKNLQEVHKFLYASMPDESEDKKTGDTLVLTFSKCNYELENSRPSENQGRQDGMEDDQNDIGINKFRINVVKEGRPASIDFLCQEQAYLMEILPDFGGIDSWSSRGRGYSDGLGQTEVTEIGVNQSNSQEYNRVDRINGNMRHSQLISRIIKIRRRQ